MKIVITTLFLSFSCMAQSWYIYPKTAAQKKMLKSKLKAQDVFLSQEKEMLPTGVNKNILKFSASFKEIELIKARFKENKIEQSSPLQLFNQYESYQWSINNNGEQQKRWLSDIDTEIKTGKKGEDLNLGSLLEGKRIVKIAVIDSGLDLNHPDLQGQIYTNKSECEGLASYNKCLLENPDRKSCHIKYAKMDSNNNGYPLDCNGWNIAGKSNPEAKITGSANINDTNGHGTHIAGIIAAKDNSIGVKGIIQSVELLPIKVGLSSIEGQTGLVADNVAKAILYAIRSKVDIINLSLGWRINQDSLLMRQMIEAAHKQNILIVAAAGNDSHDESVYPCSYKEVICVASHDIDGQLSDFSNYGPHIDITAPGTNILSTYPTNLRSKSFTLDPNYEYMSGTSQAAPQVTGALARLLNRGLSAQEAKVRLLRGTRGADEESKIRHGNVSLKGALQAKSVAFIHIVSKTASLINIAKDNTFKFQISSLLADSKNVSIELVSDAQNPLTKSKWFFPIIKKNQIIDLTSSFGKVDFKTKNFTMRVNIKTDNENKHYFHQVSPLFLISPKNASRLIQKISVDNKKDNEPDLVRGFTSITDQEGQDYLAIKEINDKTHISIIAKNNNSYSQSNFKLLARFKTLIINLSKIDLDLDGKTEYVITHLDLSKENKEVVFSIFNSDLKPKRILLTKSNRYLNDTIIMPGRFKWIKRDSLMRPVWISFGKSAIEKVKTPWSSLEKEYPQYRLYTINDEGLDSIEMEEGWFPVEFFNQSQESLIKGEVYIVAAKGNGFVKEHGIYKIHDKVSRKFTLNPAEYYNFQKAFSSSLAKSNKDGIYFYKASIEGKQKVFAIEIEADSLKIVRKTLIPPNKSDPLLRVLRFSMDKTSISQTDSRLIGHIEDKIYSTPSYTNAKRQKHEIFQTQIGVTLPESLTPNLSAHTVVLTKEAGLQAKSTDQYFAVDNCMYIGVESNSTEDKVSYFCPQESLILKKTVSE